MKIINEILKAYYKLPFRPFRKQLGGLFNKYRSKDKDKIVLVKKKGINFELNLKDRTASGIYYDFFEPTITKIFEESLNEGDVVIDVGANLGYYSLLSAKLIREKGRVYSFEPMSSAFERLKKNISLNEFKNIKLENKGVSDKEEKLEIFFQNEYEIGIDQKGEKEEVNFITIDNYVEKNKIKKLSLLKVDTDGYDFNVLKGSLKTINKLKPKIITLEISPTEDDTEEYLSLIYSLRDYIVYSDVGGKTKQYYKEEIKKLLRERGIINVILKRK